MEPQNQQPQPLSPQPPSGIPVPPGQNTSPPPYPQNGAPQETNSLAIVALITAILFPLAGFIISIISLHQIKARNQGGKGLALTGLIISIINGIITAGIMAALVASTFSGVQMKSRDVERTTDINAIHGQLEAFHDVNKYYPSVVDLENSSFRAENLRGLDDTAMTGPGVHDQYLYEVTPANCNTTGGRCQAYKITAQLEDGSLMVKESLAP